MSARDTVPVETVDVGDRVMFSWQDGDVWRSATGTVANVAVYGRTRVIHSESGSEIARYTMDHPRQVVAVMLARYTPILPGLFEYTDTDSMHEARERSK